jgi:hypothetical protein
MTYSSYLKTKAVCSTETSVTFNRLHGDMSMKCVRKDRLPNFWITKASRLSPQKYGGGGWSVSWPGLPERRVIFFGQWNSGKLGGGGGVTRNGTTKKVTNSVALSPQANYTD